ncbi:hypothetical protein MKQ68_09365 [Chitinophaga horti]|uniref:Uncharacterized protein n=1 Tax=Chitinophaga horti TaxID=2920382 RepID=A0ABY6JAV0_9BACT|nr:hypothetical protein [Chitinophaga horti]UYQ95304.1 hypothetical protein MKQ68_09365 [Chitinophaga horti]
MTKARMPLPVPFHDATCSASAGHTHPNSNSVYLLLDQHGNLWKAADRSWVSVFNITDQHITLLADARTPFLHVHQLMKALKEKKVYRLRLLLREA